MTTNRTTTDEPELNIEEIMQQIRAAIIAQNDATDGTAGVPINVSGKYLSPEFYENLYQARLTYNKVEAKLLVTKSPVPLLGPVIDWLKSKIHELTMFYVNQLAAQQRAVNAYLLQALAELGEEVERQAAEQERLNQSAVADSDRLSAKPPRQ
ncbi:MAG: hypothetical protein KDD89_17385, partial [Anaerolineales bacterium]|nr:hypothetical protein [Anaerolineales bacterium]